MSFDELLNLSLKRFWFLSNQIDRLRAKKDLRQLQLLASVTSVESYKAATEFLEKQVGQVYVWKPKNVPPVIQIDPETGLDPEFDREGLRALKRKLAAQARRKR